MTANHDEIIQATYATYASIGSTYLFLESNQDIPEYRQLITYFEIFSKEIQLPHLHLFCLANILEYMWEG